MGICRTFVRRVLWIGLLLAALLVAGCAGIKPYQPRDDRQEGLESGLYTGSEGEFVIYRKVDKPENGSEAGNRAGEMEGRKPQKPKVGSEAKKKEIQGGE